MKHDELKKFIRETIKDAIDEFAPLGVAEEDMLQEKSPPGFPEKLHDKLLSQYDGDEDKAYATMWKIFYAKKRGHKKMNEMWMAWENK
jgi:hypothetical protein